jgi:hypothetical protein
MRGTGLEKAQKVCSCPEHVLTSLVLPSDVSLRIKIPIEISGIDTGCGARAAAIEALLVPIVHSIGASGGIVQDNVVEDDSWGSNGVHADISGAQRTRICKVDDPVAADGVDPDLDAGACTSHDEAGPSTGTVGIHRCCVAGIVCECIGYTSHYTQRSWSRNTRADLVTALRTGAGGIGRTQQECMRIHR